jgi:hypothetical protein
MKLAELSEIFSINTAITSTEIHLLEEQLGFTLPKDYVFLLKEANGFMLKNGVTIYSSTDVFERNETFEVQKYAPNFLAIGDDSGGLSILINLTNNNVVSVDQGSMDPDDMKILCNSISEWILNGCLV